jgi:hypothetical protein
MSGGESSPALKGELLGRYRLLAERREELLDTIRHMSAFADPVLDACDVETQFDFPAAGDRIEQADALEARAALALSAVGHDDVVERRLFAASSSQTDRHHLEFT